MRNILAALGFAILVGLLVYSSQMDEPDAAAPQITASPIPKIDQKRWQALASPAPFATPSAAPTRDLFANPQ